MYVQGQFFIKKLSWKWISSKLATTYKAHFYFRGKLKLKAITALEAQLSEHIVQIADLELVKFILTIGR